MASSPTPSIQLSLSPLQNVSPSVSPVPSQNMQSQKSTGSGITSLTITPVSATMSSTPSQTVTGTSVNPCPFGSQFIKLCNLKANQIGPYVSSLVTIALVIAVLLALFSLFLGGIRWIIAGGDKNRVAGARSAVIAAIIGLILVFLAYFILDIVMNFFGLSLTKLSLPPLPFLNR